MAKTDKEVDIFRDTLVRYLGYANEVGEAFRAQVPRSAVRFSYVVASGYVIADAVHKGNLAKQMEWSSRWEASRKAGVAVCDTLVWQGLASVAVPGLTINRLCAAAQFVLKRSSRLPTPTRNWVVTAIGLACIPFIVKPIDRSVDYLLNNTLRHAYDVSHFLPGVVHHKRND